MTDISGLIHFITEASADARVRSAVDLILDHKIEAAAVVFFSSALGAHTLARVLNMIPLGWWYALVRATFRAVSVFGNHKLTRPAWGPIEDMIDRLILETALKAREGLKSDDPPAAAPPPPSKPQGIDPPPSLPPSESAPATCGLCGGAMPPGEEMFNYHGSSGPCPAAPPVPGA